MTFESSNTKWIESETDEQLVKNIRIAMEMGCISPAHTYDELDELICRYCKIKGIKEGEDVR